MRTRLTLARAFLLLMAVLAVVLGALVYVQGTASRAAVADSAAVQRDAASEQVRARVTAYLGQADAVVEAFGARLRARRCPLDDIAAIESCLFAAAEANPNLSEVTFTHAVRTGFAADGAPQLAVDDRWQVSVYRDRAGDGARLCTRRTWPDAGRFTAAVRCRDPGRALLAAPPEQPVGAPVPDPAAHPSFVTPASRDLSGQIVRTDLSYAELDAALPEPERRVVVTAMQAIEQGETGGEASRGIEDR